MKDLIDIALFYYDNFENLKDFLYFLKHRQKLSSTLDKIHIWFKIKPGREGIRDAQIRSCNSFPERLKKYENDVIKYKETYEEKKREHDERMKNFIEKLEAMGGSYNRETGVVCYGKSEEQKKIEEEIEYNKKEYFEKFNKQFDSVKKCFIRCENHISIKNIRDLEQRLIDLEKNVSVRPVKPIFNEEVCGPPVKPVFRKPESILKQKF